MTRYLHRLAERSLSPAPAVHSRLRLPFASIPATETPPLFEAFHQAAFEPPIETPYQTTATPVMGRAETALRSQARPIAAQGLLAPVTVRTPLGAEAAPPARDSVKRQGAGDAPAHDSSHTIPLPSEETDEVRGTASGIHPALGPHPQPLSSQSPPPVGKDSVERVSRPKPGAPLVPHHAARSQLAPPLPARLVGTKPPQSRSAARAPDVPEVHVTIGRIEVTAVHAPAAPKRPHPPAKKPMSLGEYLARRERRER